MAKFKVLLILYVEDIIVKEYVFRLPLEMVLHHGDHGVLHVFLFSGEVAGRVVFVELGGEGLDDDFAICNFFSVQFDEREHTAF